MTDQSEAAPIQGQQDAASALHPYNAMSFFIRQQLGKVGTVKLVQVQACTNAGGVTAIGTVDVLPLVNQIDGGGNPTPHGIVYNLPYFRLHGGTNAVIIDPKGIVGKPGDKNYYPGDIGLALICDRDSSVAVSTAKQGNPGSRRRFSWADGMYLGGFVSIAGVLPLQYIEFQDTGITIHSPLQVKIDTPKDVLINCATAEINATSTATVTCPTTTVHGDVILDGNLTVNGP